MGMMITMTNYNYLRPMSKLKRWIAGGFKNVEVSWLLTGDAMDYLTLSNSMFSANFGEKTIGTPGTVGYDFNHVWTIRNLVVGIYHLHPYRFPPVPSQTDRETMQALSTALGKTLLFIIDSGNDIAGYAQHYDRFTDDVDLYDSYLTLDHIFANAKWR